MGCVMSEQKQCEECGLPITVCNALASYEQAVKLFKAGRPNAAAGFVEDAKQHHNKYLESRDPEQGEN
jgi:hypothetical protein